MYAQPTAASHGAPAYGNTPSHPQQHPSSPQPLHGSGKPTIGFDYMDAGRRAAVQLGLKPPKNGADAYTMYQMLKNQEEQKMQALTKVGGDMSLMDHLAKSSSPQAVLARACHQDEKVVTHSISIAGTLNEFANGTASTTWKASNELKNIPSDAKLLPIANTVLKERNSTPVKVGVIFKGLRHFEFDNAMSGGAHEKPAHYFVEGNMHQPNSLRFSVYHRDLSADKQVRRMVANWSSVTHEGIDDSVYKYEEGEPYMFVYMDSPIIDLICKNEETYNKLGIQDSKPYTLQDGRKIAAIPSHIGVQVKQLVHDHIDEMPFGAPQTLSAEFARADGRAWNDRTALGANEDEVDLALEQRHQIDLVFQQRFQVWRPNTVTVRK